MWMHLNLPRRFFDSAWRGGPGSGPVACKKILEPFLPTPIVVTKADGTLALDYNRPQSIGRVRMFLWQLRNVRARAGRTFLPMAGRPAADAEDAVLNRELYSCKA